MKSLRYGCVVAVGLLFSLLAPTRGDDSAVGSPSDVPRIEQTLKSMMVSIDFNDASIDQSILALQSMSKQLDPAHRGVEFMVQPGASAEGRRVTLKLDNVPLGVALHYVCELSRLQYRVDDYAVSILPRASDEGLVKRTFHVGPDFVKTVSNAGLIPPVSTP